MEAETFSVPKRPLDDWIDAGLDFLTDNFAFITKSISEHLEEIIYSIMDGLMFFPPWVVILLFFLITWRLAGHKMALLTTIGLSLLWNLRLWDATIDFHKKESKL